MKGTRYINIALFACVATIALVAVPSFAQEGAVTIDDVKAAVVYRIAKFVEWPDAAFPDDSAPFVIGVMGSEAFAEALKKVVKDKTIAERKVEVRVKKNPEEAADCNIVYVHSSMEKMARGIIEMLGTAHILSVSDAKNFTKAGGVIRLYEQSRKIRFEINVSAAKRADLKISSKLLSLAKVIEE